jgi:general stress protein YciG
MAQNGEERMSQHGTSHRGFASMDASKQRAIASKGGQSVPPEKRSFSQDPQLAAQAGRKGGENVPSHERSFSRNRALAAEAGRKGGQSSRTGNRTRLQGDGADGATNTPHRGS